jgi:GTPase SAR1 family protein
MKERFRSITRSYYRGCHVLLLVFDSSCSKSFDAVLRTLNEARTSNNELYRFILVVWCVCVKWSVS